MKSNLFKVLLFCQALLIVQAEECGESLGMESGKIKDSEISASSEWDANHAAPQARLNFQAGQGKTGSWSAKYNDQAQWLQVDLKTEAKVNGIATQGRNALSQWVTSYKLQYSSDGVFFEFYKQQDGQPEKVFQGNSDQDTIVYHAVDPAIKARYIRVRPVTWSVHVSMRMELYGCHEPCRELRFVVSKKNKAFKGHVIRTIDVMDEYFCGTQCFMEPNCVSYNFMDSAFGHYKCDLNNSTHLRHPDSLNIQNGSKYRGTKNLCDSEPCMNKATCQSGYTAKGYRCQCAAGFEGAFCELETDD
ncbi:hypothetical protein ACROYT_G031309 [Oculina patagonica]